MYTQNRPKYVPEKNISEAIKPNLHFDSEKTTRILTNKLPENNTKLYSSFVLNPYPFLLSISGTQLSQLCKDLDIKKLDLQATIFLMSKHSHQSVLKSKTTAKIRKYLSNQKNYITPNNL